MASTVRVPTLDHPDLPRPPGLERLADLAENLWWTWHRDAWRLFARIDRATWARHRNPIHLLRHTDAERWSALAADDRFVGDTQALAGQLDAYLENGTPGLGADLGGPVAFLCAEFALHESLPVYSGGLGVLAGDLCKAASDAHLPMVAVGPFYRHGYFRQRIDAEGHQEHLEPDVVPADLPLRRAAVAGEPLEIAVGLDGRDVRLAVWVAQVGRVPLLLLDADVAGNPPEDRRITRQLYDADRRVRLSQEVILGVGAARALEALGIEPAVWHLNEGHSALLLLERAHRLALADDPGTSGAGGATALQRAGDGVVMTLHTPVPAGNERYTRPLAAELLSGPAAAIGLSTDALLDMGRGPDPNRPPEFDLTAFGLRHAAASNAVSRIHGETANRTWGAALGHNIASVTNGVHVPTWQGAAMRALLDDRSPTDLADEELWEAHGTQKHELMEFLGGRLTRQAVRHGVASEAVGDLAGALDPEALTIGFARRFATYKRADLVLADPDRLGQLLADPDRPVQLIFAGKAHPADLPGQALLERVVAASRRVGTAGRVFFIEDYDLRVARFLVAGVDLWLNTPRRPLEASGTSGMKAALNGVPSLSVLDGWWAEGFDGTNGWAIVGTDDKDSSTADAMYRALETEIVPTFFDRDAERRPSRWIEFMRRAMTVAMGDYSAERALGEYVDRLYRSVARGAAAAEGSSPAPAEHRPSGAVA